MCTFLRKNTLTGVYPYIDLSVRMLLCTPVSNLLVQNGHSPL